nr:MAG TPA: hypothetical protein [Caudoviricetes sp.]
MSRPITNAIGRHFNFSAFCTIFSCKFCASCQ